MKLSLRRSDSMVSFRWTPYALWLVFTRGRCASDSSVLICVTSSGEPLSIINELLASLLLSVLVFLRGLKRDSLLAWLLLDTRLYCLRRWLLRRL